MARSADPRRVTVTTEQPEVADASELAPFAARIARIADSIETVSGHVLSPITRTTLARRIVEEYPAEATAAVDRYIAALGEITAELDVAVMDLLLAIDVN
jgi:hypothetical protein